MSPATFRKTPSKGDDHETSDRNHPPPASGERPQARPLRGTGEEIDFPPVVKLFTPDAACTWLLTEIDPDNYDIAFGLCDLGMGTPELGSVSLAELESVRGRLGLAIERDRTFKADRTLLRYASEALAHGKIRA